MLRCQKPVELAHCAMWPGPVVGVGEPLARPDQHRRLLLFAGATFLVVATLAAVHVDDRYGVGAASGVWMGLTAAAHAGVWYPATYSHGFYGGTRYMPLPILFELVGRIVGGEYLVSAKVLIYAVNVALYVLVYIAARRRGAPANVALVIVATVLASSAASTTFLGIRWDSLATLLQLLAVVVVAERSTPRRAVFAGILCALAVASKVSALWAPAAIAVWLVRRSTRRLVEFATALVVTTGLLFALFESLTDGRLLRQAREFTFAGSGHSSLAEGIHRFYQLALRNERSLPLLLAIAGVVLVVSLASRQVGPYELGSAVRDSDRDRRDARFRHLREPSDRPRGSVWARRRGPLEQACKGGVDACWACCGRRVPRRGCACGGSVHAHSGRSRGSRTRASRSTRSALLDTPGASTRPNGHVRALRGCVDPDPGRPAAGGARRVHHPQAPDRGPAGARAAGAPDRYWSVQGNCVELPAHERWVVRDTRLRNCARKRDAGALSAVRNTRRRWSLHLHPTRTRYRPTARAASFRSVASARPIESAFQSDRKHRVPREHPEHDREPRLCNLPSLQHRR